MTGRQQPSSLAHWRNRHADLANVIVITVGWIVLAALVNPIGDFPLNDDWVYGDAVESIVRDGDFRLIGYTQANVISQAIWGALFCLPFGFSYTVLRFSTLTLGLGGILVLYALIREIGGDARIALLGAATLAVSPLYFDLANSFMTDVPFVSMVIIALYFIVRGLQRQSNLSLVIGVVAAFVAILNRQLALAVLLGFAAAYPIRNGWKPATVLVGIVPAALGLGLHVVYQRWLIGTGRGPQMLLAGIPIPKSLPSYLLASAKRTLIVAPYIGLFVLPVVSRPAGEAWRGSGVGRDRWTRLVCVVLGLLTFGVLIWRERLIPTLPNVLIKSGIGPLTLRDTFLLSVNEPIISPAVDKFWLVVSALGVIGCWLIVYQTVIVVSASATAQVREYLRRQAWLYWLLFVTSLTYWGLILVAVDQIGGMYDRYLVPLIPLVIVLFIASRQATSAGGLDAGHRARFPLRGIFQLVLLGCCAAFSVTATHDYLAWNSTRWRALRDLTDQDHIAADRIDGGYEFDAMMLYNPNYRRTPDKSLWWVIDDEYMIASGPLPGYREERRYLVDRWLPFPGSNIFVLRRSAAAGG